MNDTLTPPRLDIKLPKLSEGDLIALTKLMQRKADAHPLFTSWVIKLLASEYNRRQTPGAEPEMIEPPVWTLDQLGSVLMASFVFSRVPMTDAAHEFIDNLALNITADAVSALQHFGGADE
ncbi:hypothetical protein NHH03_25270 [Stieleria sp. TO1_6]|uniref:hypothetical protein n=1 Tax=Stieleria tagensis TaxID=2956795 RepID=UPI00209B7B74|nr:hypothetical protein [Stieleria tagensis]MCO8125072.1 hypothetical protein [Stieleria tagensis]